MRTSGILLPLFSLPSPYGIGTCGREAYRFVDFLEKGGQTYWQVLPICPVGAGASPYSTVCSFAGESLFIDPDRLCEEGLLTDEELSALPAGDPGTVNYETLIPARHALLSTACDRFLQSHAADPDYLAFCDQNAWWLPDYALFMSLKNEQNGAAWDTWPEELRDREPSAIAQARERLHSLVARYTAEQYLFHDQWQALKAYANAHGVKIFGDLPIYVSRDSADVWANPQEFCLRADGTPTEVAGCPPDAYAEDGQLWGNPLYRWSEMKKNGYAWWCRRLLYATVLFDRVRLDHFRGFEAYYCIPATDKTARNGHWRHGPGISLFRAAEQTGVNLSAFVAEDLGMITDGVRALLKQTGFPGMKVLQFAFAPGANSEYLPHRIGTDSVAYVGTHDNNTAIGWLTEGPAGDVAAARAYLHLTGEEGENWGLMRALWSSAADTAIVTMQDLLGLPSCARTNEPGTVGKNWRWRVSADCINDWLAGILREKAELYDRI